MTSARAQIAVLSTGGLKPVLLELAPLFEKTSGITLDLSFSPANRLKSEIDAGKAFDVAILTPPLIDELIKDGRIADGSAATIARTGVGLAVREGAAKPDIGSVEAFKRALLDARSVAYTTAGQSGVHFAGVIERLGIAAQVKAKAMTLTSGAIGELVAKGEAEFAVQLIPELMAVSGIEVVGPLPAELQAPVIMTAGIGAHAKDTAAAQALIKYLTAADVVPVIKAKGLEPG